MSPMRDAKLSTLFERALEVSPLRRAEFLDAVCDGDATLRAELASLLDAHDSSTEYFEQLAEQLGVPTLANVLGASSASSVDVLATLQSGVGDVYRIERELGGGGMSRVFLAEEIALRRHVVIKTLPQATAASVSVDRFRREIAVLAKLQHPHIVPLLAASATGGLLYYAMPFVAGQSLREKLEGGALSLRDALTIWRDVLDALAYAHANGVVHRDIKPANILLSGRHGMVTDFGIARAIEVAVIGTDPAITGPIGTPAYMAPEQATGRSSLDHRADLYAAGLVMYELLTGRPPFEATTVGEFMLAHSSRAPEPLRRSDVPAALAELVMECLAKDPAERPESAEAILARLDDQASDAGWTRALLRKPRTLGASLVAAALIALALAVWPGVGGQSARDDARSARHSMSDSTMRLYQRGLAEQRRRTLEGAVAAMNLFERAIAADSEFSLAWAATARTAQFASIRNWTISGRPADSLLAFAVRASRRALELDSSSAEAWTVAGKVAGTVDLEDRAATINALGHAIALDSTYAEAWFELGLAHEEALHPTEAERAWLRAASLSPTNVQVLAFLAYHYLWYDDYASGTRWADSAVAVDPTYFLARDAAAFLALATGRADVAIRHGEAEQRTRGHEPPLPYCLIAAALARSGESGDARRYALQAESLANSTRPSKHEAVYLAIAWSAIGDTARAIRWLSAYAPRADLHFQLHVKRDPELRWIATARPSLLTRLAQR